MEIAGLHVEPTHAYNFLPVRVVFLILKDENCKLECGACIIFIYMRFKGFHRAHQLSYCSQEKVLYSIKFEYKRIFQKSYVSINKLLLHKINKILIQ